ncbi:uncharacterized protein iftap isoform X3 [Scyliorhinus torazame]|uniref:uncharacterized protein iftap isoform X3 n=1 Tax=Scyliorhinus torazame TaxID=75743 RepID=UPI003B5CFCEC
MFLGLNISAFEMPAVFGSQPMEEGLIAFDVLDRFCSSHEQTYAEFLKSFMHLKKEDLKKQKALPPEYGTKTKVDECKLVQREWSENSGQKGGKPSKDDQETVLLVSKVSCLREPYRIVVTMFMVECTECISLVLFHTEYICYYILSSQYNECIVVIKWNNILSNLWGLSKNVKLCFSRHLIIVFFL